MKKKYVIIGGLFVTMASCLVASCAQGVKTYDESGFGGSSNNESNELVTDKMIKVDGKLDDECWQNQKPFAFTYQDVSVTVTTVFGELGFYVGYEVEDSHVYAVEGRDVWKGSSVEMYVDRGDATQKSERTFQYRLGALDQYELLYGYETKEDSWSATYLPIFGRTQVQGTVNSGSTQGMTAEIFVRWDALGYNFTAEDFVVPESVKIMPVYNQSSGAEMDSARAFWANNGGDIGNPMQYWIFNGEGFADADEAGATIGDGSYGRAKTPGWDITNEPQGIVKSKTAGDQSIFFTNVYATDYAVTALVEFKDALYYWANGLYWQKDPYPKAGLILASDTTIQAYLLNYDSEHRFGTPEGMFFRKGNPDPRETWELYDPCPLTGLCDASGKVRLTGVKVGRYLLVFVGGADAEKYGGTFVGMQEVSETAGTASPGFYTLGCEVEFTDYAATTDSETVTGLANSVLSVLKLDQKSGGALGASQLGYQKGESAVVTVKTYENYKLTSLKVNGEEKINELTEDGELTVPMSENEMTVTPVFERVDSACLAEGTLHYIEKNAPANSVAMLVTGTAKDGGKVFLDVKPSAAENNGAEWYANLPDGAYTARVLVNGIYRASKEFTVDGEDVTVPVIDTPFVWMFTGSVESKKDGSVTVRGYNQYREVTNRSATDYFAMTSFLYRDDGNFAVEGTWETGGFGVKVDGTVYRIHAMRANAQEIYLYIEVDGGASQEYRGIYYPLAGTGAPLQMDVFYINGEFRFIFGGTTTFVVNAENTPNEAIHPLFDTSKTKNVGLITVGKDMVFKDYDFAFTQAETEAMYEGYSKGRVVLPQNVTGLTVSSSVTEPMAVGTEVTLTFALEEDYTLTALTVNGVDMLKSVRGDSLTFTLKGGVNVVTAEAAIFTKYAVTGTLGYAEGLYAAGDTVLISSLSSGSFVGTLTDGNWTIRLPNGTHTVTFASERYESVTVEVTVNGEAVTVSEQVVFTTIKFTEGSAYTRDGNDVLTPESPWTGAYFAGIDAADGIRADIALQREDGSFSITGTWGTGGFMLQKNGVVFMLYVMRVSDSEAYVYLNNTSTWAPYEYSGIDVYMQGTGAPVELSLVYLGDEIHLLVDNKAVLSLNANNYQSGRLSGSDASPYAGLFTKGENDTVSIGVATMDTGSASKIRYTKLAYEPVTAIPADFQGSVKLPESVDGLQITAENEKLSGFVGEKVTLNFNLDEGKTITSLTLDGKDVLSELSAGKLTVTLTAGEHELAVVTEGVSVFAVTGTLGYAENLYATGDTVSLSSGSFVGTLTDGNWTIKLPNGTHTVTFASERYESATAEVTVNGEAVTVSEQVVFTTIKFTEGSAYTRDGNDVITPATGGWTENTAFFAGIDAADGIRVDTHMQRTDGNFFVNSTWETGGFVFEKNGTQFYLFFKMESGTAVVTLGDNASWNWNQSTWLCPRNVTGTGAPVDMSLVYLNSTIYLLIANDAVCSFDMSATTLATGSGSISVGFFTTANTSVPMQFSNFGYSAVTELPDDFKLSRPVATIFDNNNGTAVYEDGSIGFGVTATRWLWSDGGFVTSSETGDLSVTYTLQRIDGKYDEVGTWNTPMLRFYDTLTGTVWDFFAMRENETTTVLYLISSSQKCEFRINYAYQGTGAPITLSVAYSSNDGLLHIYLDGTHYTLNIDDVANTEYNLLYADRAKIPGFNVSNYGGILSDLSYKTSKEEVDAEIASWGTATAITGVVSAM